MATQGASAAHLLQCRLGNAGTNAFLARAAHRELAQCAPSWEAGSAVPTGAVEGLLARGVVHAKLEVGAADSPLEHEADAVADRMMRMGDGTCCAFCATGGACDSKPAAVRRDATTAGPATELGLDIEEQVRRLTRAGEPLPGSVRASFEPRFGADLSGVRIHSDNAAAESAQSLSANAWTLGNHISFGRGRWAPGSTAGDHLIAHELAHVVRQGTGPGVATVSPLLRQATTMSGTPGGPDPCLELIEAIIELLNEVAQRFNDALNDRWDLFKHHRRIQDAHPEHGSWDGHRDKYREKQGELRRKVAEWEIDERCRGFPLSRQQREDLKEAEEFGNKQFPEKPAPAMREAQEAEGESVWEKLRQHLPEILVGALIAAGAIAAGAALVACFASGACEIGLALAGLGALLVVGITAALRAAGVRDTSPSGPVALVDQPAEGQEPTA